MNFTPKPLLDCVGGDFDGHRSEESPDKEGYVLERLHTPHGNIPFYRHVDTTRELAVSVLTRRLPEGEAKRYLETMVDMMNQCATAE